MDDFKFHHLMRKVDRSLGLLLVLFGSCRVFITNNSHFAFPLIRKGSVSGLPSVTVTQEPLSVRSLMSVSSSMNTAIVSLFVCFFYVHPMVTLLRPLNQPAGC